MKILFLSDIHGVSLALERALEKGSELGFDRLVLLGDLMYHGPRNGVPDLYDPVKVAEILNSLSEQTIAVRGNCDAEVDQMLLKFPIMSDYSILDADGEKMFLTHGHIYNENRLPPMGAGTVLVHGHTHIAENRMLDCGMRIFNPGSVSLPKGGQERQFGYWDGERFSHHTI
jgi:putative phosphoesterase